MTTGQRILAWIIEIFGSERDVYTCRGTCGNLEFVGLRDNARRCNLARLLRGFCRACWRAQVHTHTRARARSRVIIDATSCREKHATETLRKIAGNAGAKRAKPRKAARKDDEMERRWKETWKRRWKREVMSSRDATGTCRLGALRRNKSYLPANDCCLARANSTRERNEGLCGSRVCYWLA